MMTIDNLHCRLLCASQVAYGIKGNGTFKPEQPTYDAVGFLEKPALISGGEDLIDACLVGSCKDCVILAFRGTELPSIHIDYIIDWLQNFQAKVISVDGLPGKVHEGFYHSLVNIWEPLVAEVKKQIAGGKPLFITGHSKGASMATLASLLLNNTEKIHAAHVVNIASPNTANSVFKKIYNDTLTQTHYINHLDVVPFALPTPALAERLEHLPLIGKIFKNLAKFDYQTVGIGVFIPKTGKKIYEDKSPNEYLVAISTDLNDIQTALESLHIISIVKAHSERHGTRYMTRVCQNNACIQETA